MYLLVPISALLVAAAALAWRAAPAQRQLAGATVFEDRQPAPDFALTDQFGRHTSLSEFHGRPVALTFIYTHCPDVCPLIASNMHAAHRQLGSQASQVALLVVTVDPENDTVDQIRAFSDQRRMSDEWHFMTGARDQLEPIWKNYGIYAQPSDSTGQPVAPAAQTVRQGTPPTPDQVEHSAPVYLIDRNGIERGTLPNDFTADMLSQDLQVLLNGG